jgi:hypothetical protein
VGREDGPAQKTIGTEGLGADVQDFAGTPQADVAVLVLDHL